MKKTILKLLKALFVLFLILILTLTAAIWWPMPQIEIPRKHQSIIIKSVHIIDVKTGTVIGNRDVLIQNNLIKSIDTASTLKTPAADLTINGNGKYLIPGLWDMHTHSNQQSEWLHHPLFIANGVTGVRDMSGVLNKKDSYWVGSKQRLQWNKEINNSTRISPRYVLQSSYQIDGASSVPEGYHNFFKLEKETDADSLLNYFKKEGADFIKVYQQILPKQYKTLALNAPKYGMYLAGHKPIFMSLEEAINLGQRSFEHGRIFMYESFPGADSLRKAENWRGFFSKSKKSMVLDYEPEIAERLMHRMKEKEAYWIPTLQTLKFEALAHNDDFLDNSNLKYVSWARKKLWWGFDVENNKKKNLSDSHKNISLKFYEAAKEQVRHANTLGVAIMAGTDVTDSYIFAGFSLHQELKDLTKSGLSNLEALQSATIVPATFAGLDKKYGSIEVGKIADLVLLNNNPLDQIGHSNDISAVILNGVCYDSDKIEELKNFTTGVASSFHMNVKIVYSFVGSPLIRVQFAD